MDDDVMLNIVRAVKPDPATPDKQSRQDKKAKYTMKFKKNKSNEKRKDRFQYNLLPLTEQKRQSKLPNERQYNTQSKGEEKTFKRRNNFDKDDEQELRSGAKGRKKLRFNNNQERQMLPVQEINASAVKISMPEQIKPMIMQEQNKIDVNQIDQFKLNPLLKDSLTTKNINKFTDIQEKAYKPIFQGKDSIAKASTGSGKTLAYLIPLINQYLQNKVITGRNCGTVMLIICPSRQLCVQGEKQILRCLKRAPFIVPGCLLGGQQTNHEKQRLRKGVNILFATPGRLLYHLKNTQSFVFENLKTIVFEEADRTLDMGFHQNIMDILEIIQKKVSLNNIQKILVSAHFNEKVDSLLQNLNMNEPQRIGFESNIKIEQGIQQTKEINISKNVKQQYVLMTEEQRIPMMIAYLRLIKQSKVMIFVNTIDEVQYLDYLLNNMTYRDSNGNMTKEPIQDRKVFKIHGDLDQKYRKNTYFEFRKQKSAIMISTQVASRGLDFPDLNHIILFDVPPTITDYGNRVGRTARYNSSGVSLLMLHYQQSDYAEQIRFYAPTLEMLDKDIIFEGFGSYLHRLNIRDNSLYYIQGIVRTLVKNDDQKYQLARKAYTSMLRAYAKMKNKHIFAVKRLNLKLLGRCFGINSTGGKQKVFSNQNKQSHLEAQRKKRKVQNVRKLQVSEYL